MDLFKSFGTSSKLEQDGAWVTLGGAAKILVARVGNKNYGRLLATRVDENQAVLDAKSDDSDVVSDEIMAEVYAKTILLGWEGISFDGAELEYNYENAKKALGLKDFMALVAKHAKNIENYRTQNESITTKK
jgi:hypothetical protein